MLAGCGVAGFSAMQSTLLLHGTPLHMRSRVMGLLSLSIGAAPFGILLVGALSEWLGPARALTVTSLAGVTALAATIFVWPALRKAPTRP